MKVVVTDLDGTLLDRDTYSFAAAMPAIERLKQENIPIVFCTSKTRAETEYWRAQMGVEDPFVVENGGAIVFDSERIVVLGTPIAELREALASAAIETGCVVRGFGKMSAVEIAGLTVLSPEQAALAAKREYDEPFVMDDPSRVASLRAAIEKRGKGYTRGGRFHHIIGPNDKGKAVELVLTSYKRQFRDLTAIGLGDAPNDESFLQLCDVAFRLKRGPVEWCECILGYLNQS